MIPINAGYNIDCKIKKMPNPWSRCGTGIGIGLKLKSLTIGAQLVRDFDW